MRDRLRFARSGSGAVGLALLVVVLALVLVGPLLSPHDPAESLGMAGTSPDSAYPLGLDKLGRDVLSRLLWGGRSVVGSARRRRRSRVTGSGCCSASLPGTTGVSRAR